MDRQLEAQLPAMLNMIPASARAGSLPGMPRLPTQQGLPAPSVAERHREFPDRSSSSAGGIADQRGLTESTTSGDM